jgi:hypothetical protein
LFAHTNVEVWVGIGIASFDACVVHIALAQTSADFIAAYLTSTSFIFQT